MRERAAKAIKWIGFDDDTRLRVAADAIRAALGPEDEAMVDAIAQRMADEATKQRNGLRMIRHGIDWANASPVSPAIFKSDARAAISALRAMVLPNEKGSDRE
jgi:hypothetical protein